MKLAYSPNSPYVRKCWALAIQRGIEDRIELWTVPTTDPALAAVNPLSKVPTLITDEGQAIYDSPVICEYLDSIGSGPRLFPESGPARWKALTQAALADGILDATQPRRREVALPQDEGRITYIKLQQGKVARALDALEADADSLGDLGTIGEIAIACALGYLDFRYPHEPWRPGHPKLEAWYARVAQLPPMSRTVPPGP
ncbi:glutathione S-transferase [Roseomonas alkaliterrae]|uniref:Glutathione S-transferase n=1 Tax=Neoroseomonas alkaliterrae TaxID=1452450 RepID=A0A840XXH8_9PROT|nr:glutathione S-transferase N-terminal domain-containing protein [Neoroseomonas alkaliterrae]MBB5688531.1 glutathione S-transferase [Neoroseomonas alkaliterrae]MBR0676131.1 glutathione S-transferase [Neoroseomonas alkaliterrae]